MSSGGVIIKLLSKFDDSGIKKAQHGFGGLKKTLGAIGIGFGLKAITDTLLDAAKAASADAKSTKLMNMQLSKNAGATKESLKQNSKFIESLSLQTGIMDDELRPSLSKFGNVTKNVKDAQKLLKISLDVTAGSGKSQTKIANAVAKAYAGNTKALIGMFPELKNSKNALADLTKEFEGMAVANADPFMRFNNSMDILKEKLGNAILPIITDFVDEISKPGGLIDVVGQFLDDLSNPKTEAGKMFLDIKDAVAQTFQGVKDFFALFGGGDAMKGFGVVVSELIKALPALLALKGIMMLASATTTITNLAKAIGLISAQSSIGGLATGGATVAGGALSVGLMAVSALALSQIGASIAVGMADASVKGALDKKGLKTTTASGVFGARGEVMAIPSTGDVHDLFGIKKELAANAQAKSIFNITVSNADPKATVDAIAKYVKSNGALPAYFTTGKAGR
jgi:hypothetical protein